MARCLALQWCAESSGAEIRVATQRYQRQTSFVNSSPTVSGLHSWLTALCVTLPCLHAVSKAPVLPHAAVPVRPPSARSSSVLITLAVAPSAIKDTCEVICVCPRDYVHMEVNTWQVIHLLWGPLQYTAFQPLLWFLSFHAFALHWSFYTYYTRNFPTKTPDPLIPRWVNGSSCPWPQPFVPIAPDFLRGPDLIWPYQSHLHSSLL